MGLGKLFGRKDRDPQTASTDTDDDTHDSGAGLKVVIVDDDADARDFMRMGLEVGGFEVVGEGGDGASAVEAVAKGHPDLVLVDLHMPDIGGLELLPRLKEAHWAAKFVVVSAIGATHMVEAAIEAGAVGFIQKGVSPRSINIHLEKVASAGSVKVVRPYPLNHEYP
jgi:DNA-binding NarL/FixJ family response regulator